MHVHPYSTSSQRDLFHYRAGKGIHWLKPVSQVRLAEQTQILTNAHSPLTKIPRATWPPLDTPCAVFWLHSCRYSCPPWRALRACLLQGQKTYNSRPSQKGNKKARQVTAILPKCSGQTMWDILQENRARSSPDHTSGHNSAQRMVDSRPGHGILQHRTHRIAAQLQKM